MCRAAIDRAGEGTRPYVFTALDLLAHLRLTRAYVLAGNSAKAEYAKLQ